MTNYYKEKQQLKMQLQETQNLIGNQFNCYSSPLQYNIRSKSVLDLHKNNKIKHNKIEYTFKQEHKNSNNTNITNSNMTSSEVITDTNKNLRLVKNINSNSNSDISSPKILSNLFRGPYYFQSKEEYLKYYSTPKNNNQTTEYNTESSEKNLIEFINKNNRDKSPICQYNMKHTLNRVSEINQAINKKIIKPSKSVEHIESRAKDALKQQVTKNLGEIDLEMKKFQKRRNAYMKIIFQGMDERDKAEKLKNANRLTEWEKMEQEKQMRIERMVKNKILNKTAPKPINVAEIREETYIQDTDLYTQQRQNAIINYRALHNSDKVDIEQSNSEISKPLNNKNYRQPEPEEYQMTAEWKCNLDAQRF